MTKLFPEQHSAVACASTFNSLKFADQRILNRFRRVVSSLEQSPAKSFPALFDNKADLDGFYRFMNNDRVNAADIFAAIYKTTMESISHLDSLDEPVLAIHDSTSFDLPKQESIAELNRMFRKKKGFFGHFCLATKLNREIIGVLGFSQWIRPEEMIGKRKSKQVQADPSSQTHKWIKLVKEVEYRLDTNTDRKKHRVIHVADREADDFKNFAQMLEQDIHFVFRVQHNRNILDPRYGKLFDSLKLAQLICKRDISVSARNVAYPGQRRKPILRTTTVAQLGVSAKTIQIQRGFSDHTLPASLTLNFVRVFEVEPPLGETPVEWILATTESIERPEDLLKIVDIYRARWTVEEYFKALKTGCGFEKRGFESLHSILNYLAICAPIACKLYNLKILARENPNANSNSFVTDTQLQILANTTKYDQNQLQTVENVVSAIARLGGHIKYNGPPGWQVLARGYQKLLELELGWHLAMGVQGHAQPTPRDM